MAQPYFANLVKQNGQLLTNFYAVTHPSQPNYVASIAGFTGVNDDADHDYNAATIVDLLEAKNLDWRSYQQAYPLQKSREDSQWNEFGCFFGSISANRLYWRKHNPFMSFLNVQQNAPRCAKIVNADQLLRDAAAAPKALPQLMYYTPDINNDGHDTGVNYAANWLQSFLPQLLQNQAFMNGTLITVTFDEDMYDEQNHIYTALFGPMVPKGSIDGTKYTHYSWLRSVEDNWELGTLGRNDSLANSFNSLVKADKYKPWKPSLQCC